MEFGVGSVLEGKVTGITKFGAFVALPEGKSGLVHISEIAYSYVNDVKDHLTEGQIVKVKVIGIDESNRINLSIKKAMEPPPRPQGGRPQGGPRFNNNGGGRPQGGGRPGGFGRASSAPREPASFEDRLKQFMADSDSRLSDLNRGNEKRSSRRGGGGRRGN
jgi:S1 RNA binding domain protein